MTDTPKHPDVQVHLSTGHDANAFMLISTVRRAMRKAGVPVDEIEQFATEAMSGDYDHALTTIRAWVQVS
jgi:hypothetical protein